MSKVGINFSSVSKGLKVLLKNKDIVPMIVGHAGIGKTMLVHQVAEDLGYKFEEITCSLLQEGDLALPYPTENTVKYIISHTIQGLIDYCNDNPTKKAILFLDEFNRSPIQVQAELMNLILQRNIMGVRLPDNLRIVTAANPSSDVEGYEDSGYATNEGDAAINDRTVRLRMIDDVEDWLDNYAKVVINKDGDTHIHSIVTNYLEEDGSQFFLVVDDSKDKNPTPRGYERVSNIFREFEGEGVDLYQGFDESDYGAFIIEAVKGVLGDQVGSNLINYMLSRRDYIKPLEFINEKGEDLSTKMRERIENMSDVRKKINMFSIVNYLVLKKNTHYLDGEKGLDLAKRLTEFYKLLDNDIKFILVNKLFNMVEDNKYVDKEKLTNLLFEIDDFGDDVYEVVARTSKL